MIPGRFRATLPLAASLTLEASNRRIETMADPIAGTTISTSTRADNGALAGETWDEATPSKAHQPEPEIAQRLRAQNARLSQLAGGLAHEIRNPLSTLSLNLDLLAEDFEDAETPRERRAGQRIVRLKREARRLHDILENFLRFARLQDLKLEATDLNVVVEELCDFYEPQASTRGVVVRTHFDPKLPRVPLDADAFKQAALNLMLNAEHAMPEGGELIMTTRRDGDDVVLEVIDTGAGMSDDVRSKIFDPFYSTRKGGSGLGLPTTRNIVEGHGGAIEAQSVPGKGSRFTIRLPSIAD